MEQDKTQRCFRNFKNKNQVCAHQHLFASERTVVHNYRFNEEDDSALVRCITTEITELYMTLTAVCSASDGNENCQSSCLRGYWLQLTLKEKLWILYGRIFCVLAPCLSPRLWFRSNFNGPQNWSGSQPTFVYSYSKPPAAVSAQQVNQHTVWSSTGHSCPSDVTLQVWNPTEIISKDAITTWEAS